MDNNSTATEVISETEVISNVQNKHNNKKAVAPLPSDLCRVSPFFPIARQDLGKKVFLHDEIIAENSWGQIYYTGPKLSTFDEDVFLAILVLAGVKLQYTGTMAAVLRVMGYRSADGKSNYARVKNSLVNLAGAVFVLIANRGTEAKEEFKIRNMLAKADWDGKVLDIEINSYFYQSFIKKHITYLDLNERAKIKGPVAKALHRFIRSHRDDEWPGHYKTLASALNVNTVQADAWTKRIIKKAIAELLKNGFLKKGVINGDHVYLQRRNPQKLALSKIPKTEPINILNLNYPPVEKTNCRRRTKKNCGDCELGSHCF